ncbi:hypothetical protein L0F63_001331, partial [Massospora cicadina]
NAIASAKSRQKRKEREENASIKYKELQSKACEAEQQNKDLNAQLDKLKLEHILLREEAILLRKSYQLDLELNAEIVNEIDALRKYGSNLPPNFGQPYKPLQLAFKQLEEAKELYANLSKQLESLNSMLR